MIFVIGEFTAKEMARLKEKIEETGDNIRLKRLVPWTYSRSRNLEPEEFEGSEPYTVYCHHRFRTGRKGDFKDMVQVVLDSLAEEDVIVAYNNKFS